MHHGHADAAAQAPRCGIVLPCLPMALIKHSFFGDIPMCQLMLDEVALDEITVFLYACHQIQAQTEIDCSVCVCRAQHGVDPEGPIRCGGSYGGYATEGDFYR